MARGAQKVERPRARATGDGKTKPLPLPNSAAKTRRKVRREARQTERREGSEVGDVVSGTVRILHCYGRGRQKFGSRGRAGRGRSRGRAAAKPYPRRWALGGEPHPRSRACRG